VLPRVKEKDHILVFQVKCSFLYDLDEIMAFGNTLSDQTQGQPELADFPAQQWPLMVHITVKRFKSLWKISRPFMDQEAEVGAEESLETV
jgi:hypothetical protein